MPAFPPRCSHCIPARKDHGGKLQLTPSLPLGREWVPGTEPPQELRAGPCPVILIFLGYGESLTSTWRAGDQLKVRNAEAMGTDSLMKCCFDPKVFMSWFGAKGWRWEENDFLMQLLGRCLMESATAAASPPRDVLGRLGISSGRTQVCKGALKEARGVTTWAALCVRGGGEGSCEMGRVDKPRGRGC